MKIPKPQELAETEDAANSLQVEAIVGTIVAKMSPPVGGRRIVYTHVPHHLQPAVSAQFAAAGWDTKYRDDQRDGASVELLPRRAQP